MFKNIEQDQKNLNTFKKEFELADGLGLKHQNLTQNGKKLQTLLYL